MKVTRKLILTLQILCCTIILNAQSNYIESLEHSKEMNFGERIQFMEGKEIFEFEGETLSGKMLSSKDIEGKVAVIHLWLISCPSFVTEIDELNKLVEKYKDENVEFISLTSESKEDLNDYFIPNYEFKFDIISDCGDLIMKKLNHSFGFPTTFVVDKQGKINRLMIGGSSDEEEAKENIKLELVPTIEKCLKGE